MPFLGAFPPFLERERLVCVTPGDLGFWELRDRALAELGGLHAFLPTVNLVQRLIVKFLKPRFGGRVWAHPAPGVEEPEWPSWLKDVRRP